MEIAIAETYTVDRVGNATGTGVLTTEQARAVAELARRAARHFGRPQDIEWAIERPAFALAVASDHLAGRHG